MATHFRARKIKSVDNTGFSTSNNTEGGKLVNKDGSANIKKTGIAFWKRISLYHFLLRLPRWKFLLTVFLFYGLLNTLFALIYVIIGVENLQGVLVDNDMLNNFQQAFFFSSQTLTTVGYGHISPVGLAANILASLESFIGILSFALVTGLLYGRFTRPRAYLTFSDNVLVAPYQGMKAIMIRAATYKDNHLTDVEAQITVMMYLVEDGKRTRRFFNLPLEIKKINSLALSWTLVHAINEDSPLYLMNFDDFIESEIEIMYHLKGFDDHFSNIVQQRTSYVPSDMVYGARFLPMFHKSEDNTTTIVELDKINEHELVTLPETVISGINA
jgi:inward rectifier potassium channel